MRRIVLILLLILAGQTRLSVLHADDARLESLKHRFHGVTFSATPPPTPAEFNAAAAKTFNVTARSFQFDVSPSPFFVNRGDSVTLNISVPGGDPSSHGFFLDQHMTQGVTISQGQTVTVNFIANSAGTFSYFCTFFCGDGHSSMVSTFMVNDVQTVPAPSITSFTPESGPPAGGTLVVITGANFQNGATVRFGDSAGIGTGFESATRISTFTPVRPAGAVTITVANPDGQSATSAVQFTYTAPPAAPSITTFTPANGPPAGGTVVVITGANFQNGATVRFGGTAGTGTNVESATRITTTTPVHAAGPVTISVTNPDGQSATSSSQFTYVAPAAPTRRRAVKR